MKHTLDIDDKQRLAFIHAVKFTLSHDIRLSNQERETLTNLFVGLHDTPVSETSTRRAEDFTMMELFPDDGLFKAQQHCEECGVLVLDERARQIHVAWHNKLLP